MKLYKEILSAALEDLDVSITFPNLKLNAYEIVTDKCYLALEKIRDILKTDYFSDNECYGRIEEIISVLENAGIDCSSRHDN